MCVLIFSTILYTALLSAKIIQQDTLINLRRY